MSVAQRVHGRPEKVFTIPPPQKAGDDWYNNSYVPHYRERHKDHADSRDEHRNHRDERRDGRQDHKDNHEEHRDHREEQR
jgi:hypothetical protein